MSFLRRTGALNDPRTWLISKPWSSSLSHSRWSCTSQPNNSKLWDSFGILNFFLKAAIFPNNRVLANTMSFIKHLISLRFLFPRLGNGKVRLTISHWKWSKTNIMIPWSHDRFFWGKRRFSMLEVTAAMDKDGTMNNGCLCTSELDLCPRGPPPQSKTIDLNSLESTPICGDSEAPTQQLVGLRTRYPEKSLKLGLRKAPCPPQL